MGHIRRQLLLNALKLFDVTLMMVAFGLATIVVSHGSTVTLAEFLGMRVKIQNFVIFSALLYAWHVIFRSFGIYASRRLSRRWDESLDVFKAASLGTLLVLAATAIFHIRLVTFTFLLVFWAGSTLLTITFRLALRIILRKIRLRGRNLRHMLIVGTNNKAIEFARKIEASGGLGYRIIGFVDEEWHGMEEFRQSGYPVACNFSELRDFLRENVVDEIAVTLPMRSLHSHASEIARICEEQGIMLRFMTSLFDLKVARSRADDFEGDSLITHYTGALNEGWPVVIKRVLDFSVSFIIITLLSPLLVVTALLIKLTSPGPILFVQRRLGLNKRRFNIYKFRTMVPDAEKRIKELEHLNEVSGPVFKIKNDPRITPVGRFLRKTSIDELPQLLNVLKGDMSLVGPRPLPVRDYEGFSEDWQRRRFSVRPGITCLWQIKGRSSIPFEQWMELDLQYIDKWSLWLDFEILIKTIPAVLRGSGAA